MVKLGIIADTQYADVEDKLNYTKTAMRYYRASEHQLKEAVLAFKEAKVDVILQLGDLLDGFCHKSGGETEVERCISKMKNIFSLCSSPVLHVIGNHELYNCSRKKWTEEFKIEETQGRAYYTYSLKDNWEVIVLDSFDISALDKSDKCKYEQAVHIMDTKNPNEIKDSPEGLKGVEKRWVKFNGALSKEQLEWLSQQLIRLDCEKKNVIISAHTPFHPSSCDPLCVAWNYDEVLNLLSSHKCVKICFSGHDHAGGYFQCPESLIHFITWEGGVEARPDQKSYAIMEVNKLQTRSKCQSINITGHGNMSSYSFHIR